MLTWIKRLVVLAVFVLLIGGGVYWYLGRDASGPIQYRSAKVERGELLATIGATGTLEPEEVIDVGAQVSGMILSFGKDLNGKPVDYRSNVDENMILAQIDAVPYQADKTEADAQLAQANAGVLKSQADLQTSQAKLYQAQRDWERAQKIGPGDALAQTNYDNYKSTYDQAQAAVAESEAALVSAKASVDQAKSGVLRADRNLDYCTIRSPVKGTIIDRRVNIGQTVVSSLSASSLFLIAKDLRQMQVWVAVNEADIGKIYPGQPITFTVDAFGDRTFKGTVNKVRLNASMTQNVVTYTVEINTGNDDLKLLPYMTANVQFEVTRHENVLLVPNAALRWTPATDEEVAPDARAAFVASENAAEPSNNAPQQPGPGEGRSSMGHHGPTSRPHTSDAKPGQVWIKDGDYVRPIDVMTVATDGVLTEITGEKIKEGDDVITGQIVESEGGPGGSTNPFLPNFHRGRH